jgi:hypothetical protein
MMQGTRAALAAVQQELRELDADLAGADSETAALTIAEVLVSLAKMKQKAARLCALLEPVNNDNHGRGRR